MCLQEREYPGRVSGTSMSNPDFAALAVAYGGHGETVETTEQFVGAWERSVASGLPAIIVKPHDCCWGSELHSSESASNNRAGRRSRSTLRRSPQRLPSPSCARPPRTRSRPFPARVCALVTAALTRVVERNGRQAVETTKQLVCISCTSFTGSPGALAAAIPPARGAPPAPRRLASPSAQSCGRQAC